MIADKNADDRRGVYLLAGNEEFLKEEWLKKITQTFFKEKEAFNNADLDRFYADEIDLASVLSIARTPPLFAKKRLIIIKEAQALAVQPTAGQLLSYVRSPSLTTLLILETDVKEKDFSKNKFLAELSKLAEVAHFKKLYNRELLNWIGRRFAERKKRIGPQAAGFLAQLKGNDLKAIDAEVEKLSVYAGERGLISSEDIQKLVGKDIAGGVYDLIDAISQRDARAALKTGLDFQKRDLGSAVGLFCWTLRQILRVKRGLKEGLGFEEIREELGIQRFQLERFVRQSKGIGASWIKTAQRELSGFDLDIKTSGFQDSLLGWQMLLVRLLTSL